MNNRCKNCLWRGQCSDDAACSDYTPVDEDTRSESAYKKELRRFRRMWDAYIKEDSQ